MSKPILLGPMPSSSNNAHKKTVSGTASRITNESETDLHFDTEDGQKLNWTLQIAEVNKVLASVGLRHSHTPVGWLR